MRHTLRRRQALLSSVRAFPIALVGGLVALSSITASSARAEEAQVEEVVITARDRAEKAQDVPLPISAIGKKAADREHVEDWKDVVQRVPSFTPAVANPRTGANGLRGITGISGGADGSEGDVGLIVDNVFYTHIGFSWLTQYDIDSVQIARGPQGTLLGKNTTTGAIIINTNQPSFEPQTTTETTLGSRRLVEEKFTNTGTLIPDQVAYRIAAFGQKQDGFINNQLDPSAPKGQDKDRWGVRGQLLGTFGDVTDRFIFEHAATNETNNTWGTYNDGWVTDPNGQARAIKVTNASNVSQTFNNPISALQYLYPQYAHNIGYNAWADPYTNIGSITTHTNGASNELNWRLGDYTVTSVSAWRHFDFHPNNSGGNFGIEAIDNNLSGYDVGVNQYSEELRISSASGQKFEWTAGNYFLRELISSNDRMQFGPDAVSLLQRNATNTGVNSSSILNGVEANLHGTADITTIAQFAQGTFNYDDHAKLTLGLRNSYEIRKSADFGDYFGGAALSPALQAARTDYVISEIGGTNVFLNDVQRTDSLSFLFNPSYKFNDNITAYINVARGVKSGAANTIGVPIYLTSAGNPGPTTGQVYNTIGAMNMITKPEISLDYELGFKSNWFDNHLQVNANAYLNDIGNMQATLVNYFNYTTSNGGTGALAKSYLGNIPQVRLAGFELEGRYSPIENLWVNFAGAYNGAWYVKFPQGPLPADLANETGAPTSINLSGARVPNVTPFTFSLGANYEYAAGAFAGQEWRGYVYTTESFKSTTLFSLDAAYTGDVLKQASYVIFNAGLGFKTPDSKYDIAVWAKNLTNRQALQNLSLSGSSGNSPGVIQFIDPLTIGVTFRTKF